MPLPVFAMMYLQAQQAKGARRRERRRENGEQRELLEGEASDKGGEWDAWGDLALY